jgi:hypothetical protein
MAKESTALVPFGERYPVLAEDPETLFLALTQNLPGAQLSPWDLTRWSVKGANANSFENNDKDAVDQIEGVVMAARAGSRNLYIDGYKPGVSLPPDCSSSDGVVGNFNGDTFADRKLAPPSGKCLSCDYSKFGSFKLIPGMQSPSGNAPACKERVIMLLMRPGASIPCVVNLPATALKAVKRYLMIRLTEAGGLRPYSLETVLTVSGGQVALAMGQRVPDDLVPALAKMAEQFQRDLANLAAEDLEAVAAEAEA